MNKIVNFNVILDRRMGEKAQRPVIHVAIVRASGESSYYPNVNIERVRTIKCIYEQTDMLRIVSIDVLKSSLLEKDDLIHSFERMSRPKKLRLDAELLGALQDE